MRKSIFSIIIFFFYVLSYSQTSTNLEVISSAGDYFAPAGSNITLSWTLGEPVIETFAPNGSQVILTQGFQQPFEVNQAGKYSVEGYVNYDNTLLSPLSNTQVNLINSELVNVGTTTTDVSGHFVFNNIPNGSYTFTLAASATWGGSNASDALLINKYFITTYSFKDALTKKAANVDNAGNPTPTDALYILRRFVKLISTFKISDWLFENPTVTVAGANITQNIKAVCAGDVNADRKFTKALTEDLSLQNTGIINVSQGQEFDLPLTVGNNLNLGAFDLVIKYPAKNLNVKDITSTLNGFVYNIINDEIRISWADNSNNGIKLNTNDALIKIKLIAYNIPKDNEVQLDLGMESALYDNNASAYKGENLYAPRIAFETVSSDFYLGQNYPNPFKNTTQIDYRLSEAAQVSVKVFNLLGEQMSEIVNSYQEAGYHHINYNVKDIADGVYMYRMDVSSANSQFSKTKMMIINK